MNTLRRAHAWIITRTGGPDNADRGGSPLIVGIITAGLAVLAVVVVGIIVAKTNSYLGQLDGLTP